MASQYYERMLEKRKVYVLPDVTPWASRTGSSNAFLSEALVTDMSIYTGANIGQATLRFPKKDFGDHVGQNVPLKIAVNTIDNIVFRGFITEENGELSTDEDGVTCSAMDYKWYFSKVTRIRGNFFTTEGAVPNMYGSPNSQGQSKLVHEMFKGTLAVEGGDWFKNNANAGYLQDVPCTFNEEGLPDCATAGHSGIKSVFKKRKIWVKDGLQYTRKYNYGAHYWTFSSILAHIVYWWLDPYAYIFTKIKIANDTFSHLSRLSGDQETPFNLSIENTNPLEAIDKVVKAIPGKWIWYIDYSGSNVLIHVMDIERPVRLKKLYIGNNKKIAENAVNVANVEVTRNTEESVKYLILKGGKIKLTTTVELYPVWKSYDIHIDTKDYPTPFSTVEEFGDWKSYMADKKKEEGTNKAIKKLYEQAYRYYCIPMEGGLLVDALQQVSWKPNRQFTDLRYRRLYGAIQNVFSKMFAQQVVMDRELEAPVHPEFENPVFFAYDDYYSTNIAKEKDTSTFEEDESRKIQVLEEVNFSADTGLVIFKQPQHCRFYVGEKSKSDKDKTSKEVTDLPEGIKNISNIYKDHTGDDASLVSRRIFCTLSITVDLPFVYGDDKKSVITQLSGSNFSRYMDFENDDLDIHVNAFYPHQPNSNVDITVPSAYNNNALIFAKKRDNDDFACVLSKDMLENNLYPYKFSEDYEMFPNDSDKLMIQKLQNFIDSLNWYMETINADLGVLDVTYRLGDVISAIVNSETGEVSSGYFGLRDYVSTISYALEGQSEAYKTTLVATNDIDFQPTDYEKSMQDIVRRPRLGEKYKSNSYLQVEN